MKDKVHKKAKNKNLNQKYEQGKVLGGGYQKRLKPNGPKHFRKCFLIKRIASTILRMAT